MTAPWWFWRTCTWLRWAAMRAGYWVRPYSMAMDSRRWFWQPTGCSWQPRPWCGRCRAGCWVCSNRRALVPVRICYTLCFRWHRPDYQATHRAVDRLVGEALRRSMW